MASRIVAAVDPGGTSGWCIAEIGEGGSVGAVRGGQCEDPAALSNLVLNPKVNICVIEDFVAYAGRSHMGQKAESGLSPVYVEGFLRGAAHSSKWKGRFEKQMASAAKGIITDERLRAMGMWVKGEQHQRDARRHLLLFARRIRNGEVDL